MKSPLQLKQSLQQILMKNMSAKAKALLVEGLIEHIRSLPTSIELVSIQSSSFPHTNCKLQTTQTNATYADQESMISNISNLELTSRILPQMLFSSDKSIENDLQERILQKQRLKYQLNEDIQTYEDDLFQLNKVLLTKMEYNQQLEKKIQQKTYLINKLSIHPMEQERKSLSFRLRNLFI